MTEHAMPPGFLVELQRMTIWELAIMRHELKQYPEDVQFLIATDREIKRRAMLPPAPIQDETHD